MRAPPDSRVGHRATDALTELRYALDRDGRPRTGNAHVERTNLRAIWDACESPETLAVVGSWTVDRRLAAEVACRCARWALRHAAMPERRRLANALDVAERWARGDGELEALRAAFAAAAEIADRLLDTDYPTHCAACAVQAALDVALGADADANAVPASFVDAAIEAAAAANQDRDAARAALAKIVRAGFPCPSLDDLRVACDGESPDRPFVHEAVLQYHSLSKDAPPGRGAGEELRVPGLVFADLAAHRDWRRTLSNFAETPFLLDAWTWRSVEHAFQAAKFATLDPAYYRSFAIESGSPLSAATAGAIKAAGGRRARPLEPADLAHWDRVKGALMRRALFAKFSQHAEARAVLLATRDAQLTHRPPRVRYTRTEVELMDVRRQLGAT